MKQEVVTKAWVVKAGPDGKVRQISRRYHVKSAADEFARQAEKAGHINVSVEAVRGVDTAYGM